MHFYIKKQKSREKDLINELSHFLKYFNILLYIVCVVDIIMFLKKECKKTKTGMKTYIRIVESFRDDGVSKHRPIKNYGYLEDQEDPKAFMEMVNRELRVLDKHKDNDITIKIKSKDNLLNGPINIAYHYGYRYLESIYDYLKIDEFLNNHQQSLGGKNQYLISDIFKYLVFERILAPASKRKSLSNASYYYDKDFNFSLDDLYRSLDLIEPVYQDLQIHMRNQINALNIKKENQLYYDVTNYYCEIDLNDLADGLRKRGVSKEHRISPIIGLGLFMDNNGLPVSFQLFPGNASESTTFISGLNEVKRVNNLSRVICVADKGINSLKNINYLVENKDGYLFSQILKGKKGKKYGDNMFNGGFTIITDDNGEVIYQYKTYIEKIKLTKTNGETHDVDQQVLIYYSKEHALMEKNKRDEQIDRALRSLQNNAYSVEHGYKRYILKDQNKKGIGINYELIKEEEKYDGYFCLITSETHLKHDEIKKIYSNLWEIEDTFRVTKTDLEFRPIYHYKQEHIISHFLICFTSLVVLRLLQYKLQQSNINLSSARIITVLKRMKLEKVSNDIYHLHSISGSRAYRELIEKGKTVYTNQLTQEDQIEKDLKLLYIAFGVEMDEAYVKVEKFNKYLKDIKFHTTTA